MTTPTKQTARERAERLCHSFRYSPHSHLRECGECLRITAEIEAAAQAAREEERALGTCGKHPRACWSPSVPQAHPHSGCLACAREARAVEEAVLRERKAYMGTIVPQAEARVRRDVYLEVAKWAAQQWNASVAQRPDVNIYKAGMDKTLKMVESYWLDRHNAIERGSSA